MKKAIRIDGDGLFIEDVLLNDIEDLPNDCITIQCENGFYTPKWDGEKWIEGKSQSEIDQINNDVLLIDIRQRRETECFSVVNRGKLWYDTLTDDQKIELNNWYQEWLNATDTLLPPDKPDWIK